MKANASRAIKNHVNDKNRNETDHTQQNGDCEKVGEKGKTKKHVDCLRLTYSRKR